LQRSIPKWLDSPSTSQTLPLPNPIRLFSCKNRKLSLLFALIDRRHAGGDQHKGKTMAKVFRPSTRESSILSKIESSKEYARRRSLNAIQDCIDSLANAIAMKLVENKLVETTNKNGLEDQIHGCLDRVSRADDFDIDYLVAPYRNLVSQPHIVSLYVTAFVLEKVINHKDTVDIYGSDEEIYQCIHRQVQKHLT
jgi:hypothetical protein